MPQHCLHLEPGRYQRALRRFVLVSTNYERPAASFSKPTKMATIGVTIIGGGDIIVTMTTVAGGGGIIIASTAMTIDGTLGVIAMTVTTATIATIGTGASREVLPPIRPPNKPKGLNV